MERLKPLPQGFLAATAAKRSQEADSISPTKPDGVSTNPRSVSKRGSSPNVFSSNALFNSRTASAIDAIPLPGQIVSSMHRRSGTSLDEASAPAKVEFGGNTTQTDENFHPKFWIKISATNLPLVSGRDIDPICLVSQSGSLLHKTEVALNDSDPDFSVAYKIDASTNPPRTLDFRIYDATDLQLQDTQVGAGVLIEGDDLTKWLAGEKKGSLLHDSTVEVEKLVALICDHKLNPASSLIYKLSDHDINRKSNIFLTLFPIEDDELSVLQDERKHLFEFQDKTCAEAAEDFPVTHVAVLDALPWHMCTMQNAVATVELYKKTQTKEPSEMQPSNVFSLILEAIRCKQLCLGSQSPSEVEHATEHPDYSRLINTMKKLKDVALDTPESFYQMTDYGAPAILFGFVIGSLHNLYEDFGLKRQDVFDPSVKQEDELMDWWDILYWLKQGLLDSAIESGVSGTVLRAMMNSIYSQDSDSIEAAADYEFQWLLCRTFSNETLTFNDACQFVYEERLKQIVSNEYTGENVLHILIVQNHTAKYNLAWHLDVLFKFVTHSQFRFNLIFGKVTGRFFCPVHGGHTDIGQTPLHFAVALDSADTVKTLLKLCPDDPSKAPNSGLSSMVLTNASRHTLLWQKDSIGNNVLHICVKRNNTRMYDLLRIIFLDLEKVLKKTDWWLLQTEGPKTVTDDDHLKNYEGRTPVELAAVLGNMEFICHIIEKDKITRWSYGDVSLNMYLIRDFDSYKTVTHDRLPKKGSKYKSWHSKTIAHIKAWAQPRSLNETNVLQLLVDLEQKELLNNIALIRGILDHKYQTFGRHILLVWFVLICCIFSVFEVNVYMRLTEEVAGEASGEVVTRMLPFSHPAAILQVVMAASLLVFSFLYSVNQGVPPFVEVGHTGVAVKFQTHRVEDCTRDDPFELVYIEQPFWLTRKHQSKLKRSASLLDKHNMKMEKNRMSASSEIELDKEDKEKISESTMKVAGCAALLLKLFLYALFRCFAAPLQLWSVLVLIEKICSSFLDGADAEIVSVVLLSVASFAFFCSFELFYRVSDKLGPFLVLIRRMLFGDLLMWAAVVVLFVLATAQAMHIILSDDWSFLYAYQWLLGDTNTELGAKSDAFQTLILVLFVILTLILSLALLNTLIAMFGATYANVMDQSQATWMLQRAELMLLIERVLYFCPAPILRLLGYRVLPEGHGKRKTILRMMAEPWPAVSFSLRYALLLWKRIWGDGHTYYWVNIRSGMRPHLNPNHEEELRMTAAKFAEENPRLSLKTANPLMSFPLKWHSIWTASVPNFIAEYHQVENDDDLVYLLSFQTTGLKQEA